MSADKQLAAFVDRVLRMKEEADGIAEDIKAIYAEAKNEGYDKTQLGNLVTYLRKRAKDKDGEAEKEAVFDLYLTAYMRAKGEVGTERATHTHASETQSRPTAGSDLTTPPSLNGQVATHPVANVEEDANGAIAAASNDPASREVDDADRQQVATSGFTGERGPGSVKPVAAAQDREPNQTETANNVGEAQKVERRSPKPEDAGSIPAADANTVDFRKALRPHCLKPHSCGGMGREHCWSCKKAMNAAGAA